MHWHIVAFSVWVSSSIPFRDCVPLPPSRSASWGFWGGTQGPHLDRVESTIAIERETDDVRGVLVPASVDRVAHDIPGLREDLLNEGFLATECDAFTQVGGNAYHQAVTGPAATSLLLLLLPAFQLPNHGLQLVVARLLIQQVKVLWANTQRQASSR